MKNVTISLDEPTYRLVKERATAAGLSLNAFIRKLLGQEVGNEGSGGVEGFIEHAMEASTLAKPWKWNRDEIYEDE